MVNYAVDILKYLMEFSCIFSFVSIVFSEIGCPSFIGRELMNFSLCDLSVGHCVKMCSTVSSAELHNVHVGDIFGDILFRECLESFCEKQHLM